MYPTEEVGTVVENSDVGGTGGSGAVFRTEGGNGGAAVPPL